MEGVLSYVQLPWCIQRVESLLEQLLLFGKVCALVSMVRDQRSLKLRSSSFESSTRPSAPSRLGANHRFAEVVPGKRRRVACTHILYFAERLVVPSIRKWTQSSSRHMDQLMKLDLSEQLTEPWRARMVQFHRNGFGLEVRPVPAATL